MENLVFPQVCIVATLFHPLLWWRLQIANAAESMIGRDQGPHCQESSVPALPQST
jgi:hypothetical protein